ncbi:MAG TPA: RNA polymerase sigma factor [Candidatus Eisenbacteria bacterium]|nr:RNA polymerase sigma factor [Candidatus Eisenbacteria bacterium]
MKVGREPWEGRPTEESTLIDRAKRGDLDAYEDLVRRHESAALRTAAILVSEPMDAEEAVQDAFVKAQAALARFRDGAPFRPWLLRIVANEARNRRRSAQRRQGVALRLAEDRRDDDAAPSPEAAVLVRERRAALLDALAKLREDDRLVIAYRYLLDLNETETAEALGVPKGTVKSRSSRALGRLRAVLSSGEGLR